MREWKCGEQKIRQYRPVWQAPNNTKFRTESTTTNSEKKRKQAGVFLSRILHPRILSRPIKLHGCVAELPAIELISPSIALTSDVCVCVCVFVGIYSVAKNKPLGKHQ